ncbi:uncharacterized protein TNCV_4126561 [Trichonephila clavipes]|nr:uncharacterized protein TNCV_4126561 [Trichonephila clavipes]
MAPQTITPANRSGVSRCKAKAGLRRSPRGLHTRLSTLPRLNLNSSLKTTWLHSATVQFPRARHNSKLRRRMVGVKGSARHGAQRSEMSFSQAPCSYKLMGCPTCLPNLSQICSPGDKAGDQAGQGRVVVTVRRQSCDILAG